MKLLEIRRVKAYQHEMERQALKQNGNAISSSPSSTSNSKTHENGNNGDSKGQSRKRKISSADRSKSLIEKFTKVCKSEYSINNYYMQLNLTV